MPRTEGTSLYFAMITGALLAASGPAGSDASPEVSDEKPVLLVLRLTASGGVTDELASAVTDAVTGEVGSRGVYRVISANEVQTILSQERQRQLTGCTEGGCLTELAGAIGARFVLSGSLAKLGTSFQLSLQTVDSVKAQTIGRSTVLSKDLDELRTAIPFAVAEASGMPLPAPPSKVLPYSLIAVGTAAAIFGGLAGLDAVSRDRAMQTELENGEQRPGLLRTQDDYRAEVEQIGLERTVSLSAMAAGVALAATGVYFSLDRTPKANLQVQAALTPSSGGVVLTGVW